MAKLLALGAVVLLTACGASHSDSSSPPPLHVADSATRLTTLLQQHGVNVITVKGQRPAPLGKAWQAFRDFAALDVDGGDLADDPMADALLFEAGVYDSSTAWGRTFELDFVRQYGMKDDDIQQVHLVAHFRPAAFDAIRSRIGIVSCGTQFSPARVGDCDGLCSYSGQKAILGSPCRIVPAVLGDRAGRALTDLSMWSYETGGDSPAAQHESWLESVDASLMLQRALESNELLGYDVYQDSAE